MNTIDFLGEILGARGGGIPPMMVPNMPNVRDMWWATCHTQHGVGVAWLGNVKADRHFFDNVRRQWCEKCLLVIMASWVIQSKLLR